MTQVVIKRSISTMQWLPILLSDNYSQKSMLLAAVSVLFPGSPPLPLSGHVDRRSLLPGLQDWPTSPFPPSRSRPLKFSKTSLPSLNVLAFKTLRMNHPVHIIHNLMLSSTGYRTGFYHYFHESYCHFRLSYEATILSAPLLSADISIYQFLLFGSARWHVGS